MGNRTVIDDPVDALALPIGTLISYLHVPGRLLPSGFRLYASQQEKLWDDEDDNPFRPGPPVYVILEKYK